MIKTLTHRARAICSTSQLLNSELQHLEKVLIQCKYPRLVTNKVLKKKQQHQQKDTAKERHIPSPTKKRCHIVLPCAQGNCESFKNICQKYGVQVHFKGTTLKNLLVIPKDKDTITKKSSLLYWFKCDKIDCEDEYIGESSRRFGERYKEHLKAPSPILSTKTTLATQHLWKTSRS